MCGLIWVPVVLRKLFQPSGISRLSCRHSSTSTAGEDFAIGRYHQRSYIWNRASHAPCCTAAPSVLCTTAEHTVRTFRPPNNHQDDFAPHPTRPRSQSSLDLKERPVAHVGHDWTHDHPTLTIDTLSTLPTRFFTVRHLTATRYCTQPWLMTEPTASMNPRTGYCPV